MNMIELANGLLIEFDEQKSNWLASNPQRRCSFYDAMHILEDPNTIFDSNDESPPKHLAIGWVKTKLVTMVFETRNHKELGDYGHLVTLWKTTKEERKRYGIK